MKQFQILLKNSSLKKIYIIGNTGSGKTFLAEKLSLKYNLPVFHMDQYQFSKDFQPKDRFLYEAQVENILKTNDQWIIDGFGPYSKIFKIMDQADHIVFLDPNQFVNLFWLTYRTVKNFFSRRNELLEFQKETSIQHILKIYSDYDRVRKKMLPEIRKILKRESYEKKSSTVT